LSLIPRRRLTDADERQLLVEVARLYAALTRVLRTGDIDALHADLADLLHHPPHPTRRCMFTLAFWKAAGERAAKSAGQFGAAVVAADWLEPGNWEVLQASIWTVLSAAGVGAVMSLLTSLASAQIGVHGSPSLAADAEVEAATGPA
jgi:hypothetical protein